MRITPRKLLFAVAALGPVLRASLRAAVLHRGDDLTATADDLRDVPHFKLQTLRNARWLDALVDRLLPWLPPYRLSPCTKRSLLLLDLWSRCGLDPVLHVGIAGEASQRRAHAWVSAAIAPIDPVTPAYTEVWRV